MQVAQPFLCWKAYNRGVVDETMDNVTLKSSGCKKKIQAAQIYIEDVSQKTLPGFPSGALKVYGVEMIT